MAVTEWNWTKRKPHQGDSVFFKSDYEKKTKRFEHLQFKNNKLKITNYENI